MKRLTRKHSKTYRPNHTACIPERASSIGVRILWTKGATLLRSGPLDSWSTFFSHLTDMDSSVQPSGLEYVTMVGRMLAVAIEVSAPLLNLKHRTHNHVPVSSS